MNNRVNSGKAKAALMMALAMPIPSQAASQAEGVEIRAQARRQRNTAEVPGIPYGDGDMTQSSEKSVGYCFKNVLLQTGQQADVKTKLLSGAWQAAQASAMCANTGTFTNSRQFGFPVVFATSAAKLSLATTKTVSNTPGPQLIRKMVTRLKRLAVDPMPNGAYVGIAHPNWIAGLYANAAYRALVVNYNEGPKESYFKATPTHRLFGVEIAESPNVPRYATSALSCTPIFIAGQGALGVVELGGGGGADSDGGPTGAMEIIIKRPGPTTTSEPYNLNMTVAFKLRSVAAVLNPSCGVIGLASEQL